MAGPWCPNIFSSLEIGTDDDAAGIKVQAFAEAFQTGLFGTPDQVDRKELIERRLKNKRNLFRRKVIRDEVPFPRFNPFQITAYGEAALSNGAETSVPAVAEGN